MSTKNPPIELPRLNELLSIDSSVRMNEEPPSLELSPSAHFAGLVAVGGNFDFKTLLSAYENGIFPWPHGEQSQLWFCPVWRGVIDFDELHIPKSLNKSIKRSRFVFSINRAFPEVIQKCATIFRPGQEGTWITDELLEGYIELHKKGYAHSLEAWEEGRLVSGIYGICAGGNFGAESMFGTQSDSSKIVLLKLIQWLKESGFNFLDVQMITPVTKSLGGKYIKRRDFITRLLRLQKSSPSLDFGFIDDYSGER